MTHSRAYKVFTAAEWSAFKDTGIFSGSAADQQDGFIHLSLATQLDETIKRHFSEQAIVIAEIDLLHYADTVRWEPSRDGALFPHIYAPALLYRSVTGEPQFRALVQRHAGRRAPPGP